MGKVTKREYWLDNYKGPCKGGYYFRSDIFKDIDDFEKRTGRHVVAIIMDRKHESDRPSFNIELVLEMTEEDVKSEVEKDGGENLTMIQQIGKAEEPDAYDEYGRAIKYIDDGRGDNDE